MQYDSLEMQFFALFCLAINVFQLIQAKSLAGQLQENYLLIIYCSISDSCVIVLNSFTIRLSLTKIHFTGKRNDCIF